MIDCTSKSCPKKYDQIINFAGYLEEINSIVPIFMIPCTGKNEFLDDTIFKDIILILNQRV